MIDFETGYGANFEKPALHVKHSELQPENSESDFKSKCPACTGGLLLMRRTFATGLMENTDTCIVCAQQIIYDDVTAKGWVPTKRKESDNEIERSKTS